MFDLTGLINKFLNNSSFKEFTVDAEVLALRSETIRKVDCAITVKETVEPLIKVIRMNAFIFVTTMIAFGISGNLGLFLCLLGLGVNLYYSKIQSEAILKVQDKYKIR